MKGKIIICICAAAAIAVTAVLLCLRLYSFDKSDPIIFEMLVAKDYAYIKYNENEYVPYSAVSPADRGEYLGYIKDDKTEEIYTFKGYSKDEWLISYCNGEGMLFKEKNVTNIPDGLTSEYQWNNASKAAVSELEQKGYDIFKAEYCITDHSKEIAGDALTGWCCSLCGAHAVNSDTNVPKLCYNCAQTTGRCSQCGKLKK